MKTKLAWIGMMSLALAACEEKKIVKPTPPVPEKKLVTKAPRAPRTTSMHPASPATATATDPAPAEDVGIAQTSGEGAAAAGEPPARTAWVPSNPETLRLQEERKARMAQAQGERTAQMTEQITNRFKQQDANGDGMLAKDEVDGRMQGRFTEADKNGDGFLDATEQAAMVQGVADRFGQGGGGGGGQRRGRGQGGGGQGQDGGQAGRNR